MTIPRGRSWRLRGSRTRTAVLAAVLATLILVPLAVLGRVGAADWQDAQTRSAGQQQATSLIRYLRNGAVPTFTQGGLPFEISWANGILTSSEDIQPFERSGPLIVWKAASSVGPSTGAGSATAGSVAEQPRFTVESFTFPSTLNGTASPESTRLIGLRVDMVATSIRLSTLPRGQFDQLAPLSGDTLIRVYVFLTPFATQLLQHRIDIGLALGLPLLVGLAALCAGIAVGRSMRSVERLRRQTVAATAPGSTALVVSDTDDELSAMAGAINDNVQRLRDSLAAQRQFVADAAHELRNPLSVLISGLEIADRYPGKASWPEVSAQALRSARRLHVLTQDLLTLAQLDADAPARTEPLSLRDLCTDLIAARQPAARRVELLDGPDPTVLGDRARLARVVGNLLDNGIRHARTSVSVRVGTEAGQAIVDVHNDGPAIAEADRERIFDRFTRLDEARTRDGGGTGLGLAIAREAAQRHGGTVTALPTVMSADSAGKSASSGTGSGTGTGTGATFRVRLPQADPIAARV
jgi:signal transduction histidine kinase